MIFFNKKYLNVFFSSYGNLLVLFLLFVTPIQVTSQWLSPGDLSKAHKELEGIENCTTCHTIGDDIQPEKCLTCHSKLKLEIEEKRGYHYLNKDKSCTECHKEHRGLEHNLITLDENNFAKEHAELGFRLEGKHAELECIECHKTPGTYTGLDKNCLSCHEDTYHGRLDEDCSKCHTFDSFTPSIYKHDETDLAFTIAHQNVECKSCHINGNYKDVNTQCLTCHEDEHKGQLSNDWRL